MQEKFAKFGKTEGFLRERKSVFESLRCIVESRAAYANKIYLSKDAASPLAQQATHAWIEFTFVHFWMHERCFYRFSVYLQHGVHHEPNLIAMCFDARFMYGNDRNCVVRNHKQGGWGTEEKYVPFFPFMPNTQFEMIILVEPHCFKVLQLLIM